MFNYALGRESVADASLSRAQRWGYRRFLIEVDHERRAGDMQLIILDKRTGSPIFMEKSVGIASPNFT